MQILIRRIQRDRKGNEELFETSIAGSQLSVGHRNDQNLQLLDPEIAALHAVLSAGRGGRFALRCIGAARVRLDGKSVANAKLRPGSRVELGRQTLTVVPPPPGFDAAVEVLAIAQGEGYGPATHFVIDLDRTGLRPRRWAWSALALILVLGLLLPLAGYWQPGFGQWLRAQALFPSDAAWSSGPISNAHHGPDIGTDCNVCHQRLFEPTPDRACRHCHQNVQGHYHSDQLTREPTGSANCASCHREHNQPGNLVRADSGLCVDCHGDLNPVLLADPVEPLLPVRGFNASDHPAFRLTLLRFDAGAWTWSESRESVVDSLPPREGSNLRFSHRTHLDPVKVHRTDTGAAPGCSDCHSLASDGEHFQPINMESRCRSCHSLAFDENEPLKQLPHADVAAAVTALEEHFLRRQLVPQSALQSVRRRPGQALIADPCTRNPVACAHDRADLEAENQFTRSGCITCHEVREQPGLPPATRWQVLPVRLVVDWYPHARFDHAVHLGVAIDGQVGDRNCLGCHAADRSEASADILIPTLQRCLDCHGERRGAGIVKLDCSACHAFHPAAPRPRPDAVAASAASPENQP